MTILPNVHVDMFHLVTAIIIWHYCRYPYTAATISDFLPVFLPHCLQLTGRDAYKSWKSLVSLMEETETRKGFTLRRDVTTVMQQMREKMKMELFFQQLVQLIRESALGPDPVRSILLVHNMPFSLFR